MRYDLFLSRIRHGCLQPGPVRTPRPRVQAELAEQGFTANQITISDKGESENLVPTGDGVREPQNRCVEIVMDP